MMYEYKAFVSRVVDGDTFDALVDLGFKCYSTQRFRLKDIDTPETWRPKTNKEAEHGHRAHKFVADLIEGRDISIRSVKLAVYNRYEALVTLEDGSDLSTLLREAGYEKLNEYVDEDPKKNKE